jgi:mycothiol synthase
MADITLPSPLTSRPATPEDVPAITSLIAACELHDDGEAEIDPDDVAFTFDRAGAAADDTIVVFDGEDLVAWGDVYKERAEADVHPERRGEGIGSRVLAWAEARARETGQPRVRQVVTDANTGAAALFRAHGYEPAYTSWILQIAFDPSTAPVPEVAEGIVIRSFAWSDAQAAHRVIDDAFTEWNGREPMSFDEWKPFIVGHGSFAPALSAVAFDGDEMVGAALALDYENADEGWVQQLATKATHRHRGIARALLQTVFAAFHERGKAKCGLSTDSRTGALSLYERVGMQVRRSYTSYAKQLH